MSGPWEEIQGVKIELREICIEGMPEDKLKQAITASVPETTARTGPWDNIRQLSGGPQEWYINATSKEDLREALMIALREKDESRDPIKMEAPEYIEDCEVIGSSDEHKQTPLASKSNKRKGLPAEKGKEKRKYSRVEHDTGNEREQRVDEIILQSRVETDENMQPEEDCDLDIRRSGQLMSCTRNHPTGLNGDNDGNSEVQALKSQLPQQKHQQIAGKPSHGTFLAKDVEMLVRIPDQSGTWHWKSIDRLSSEVRNELKKRWMADIVGDSKTMTKAKSWRLHTNYTETYAAKEACVGRSIAKAGAATPPLSKQFQQYGGVLRQSACDRCINKDKLCAHWIKHDGIFKLGFVPLPELLRRDKSWREVNFWLRK